MSHKVYVDVKVRLIINAEDDTIIDDVISEMDYSFNSTTDDADIIETEITGHEIVDSK